MFVCIAEKGTDKKTLSTRNAWPNPGRILIPARLGQPEGDSDAGGDHLSVTDRRYRIFAHQLPGRVELMNDVS